MIRTVFLIGRILAAVGAVLVVAVLANFVLELRSASECSEEPDCDDVAFQDAFEQVVVALPIAILVGAAGVALVYDTRRTL